MAERKFHKAIELCIKLALLSKQLMDSKPAMYIYQMLGSLMMSAGYLRDSFKLFEVARDLAHEAQNQAHEMVCYELIGRAKQELREF